MKCSHKSIASAREIIFRCQFHTDAVEKNFLRLEKSQLDGAHKGWCACSYYCSHGDFNGSRGSDHGSHGDTDGSYDDDGSHGGDHCSHGDTDGSYDGSHGNDGSHG